MTSYANSAGELKASAPLQDEFAYVYVGAISSLPQNSFKTENTPQVAGTVIALLLLAIVHLLTVASRLVHKESMEKKPSRPLDRSCPFTRTQTIIWKTVYFFPRHTVCHLPFPTCPDLLRRVEVGLRKGCSRPGRARGTTDNYVHGIVPKYVLLVNADSAFYRGLQHVQQRTS